MVRSLTPGLARSRQRKEHGAYLWNGYLMTLVPAEQLKNVIQALGLERKVRHSGTKEDAWNR